MDSFDRLKIKNQILSKSQSPDSDIHPLSYEHLEIITPRHIDDTLLEEIDNQNPNTPLTDELFFECLSDSVDYLAYEAFRQKIRFWQDALENLSPASKAEKEKARENLKKISQSILMRYDGRGRPSKWDGWERILGSEYEKVVGKIGTFFEDNKDKIPSEKYKIFLEKFPFWKDYIDNSLRNKRSAKEAAKMIIGKKYGISLRDLQRCLKASGHTTK